MFQQGFGKEASCIPNRMGSSFNINILLKSKLKFNDATSRYMKTCQIRGTVKHVFKGHLNTVKHVFKGHLNTVKHVFKGDLNTVKHVFKGDLNTVKPVFKGHLNTVKHVFKGHLNIWEKCPYMTGVPSSQDTFWENVPWSQGVLSSECPLRTGFIVYRDIWI